MSGLNGDKSRFNRRRKQKIARRQRNREGLSLEQPKSQSGLAAKGPKRGTA